MSLLSRSPRIERQEKRRRERDHGDREVAPARPVKILPPSVPAGFPGGLQAPFKDFRIHQRGTRVDSMISRRIASDCADFFCVVANRVLTTTRCANTGRMSLLYA